MTSIAHVTVYEEPEAQTRLTGWRALTDEAERFGWTLPDHAEEWVPGPDAAAAEVIAARISRLRGTGRGDALTLVSNGGVTGFRMDVGGVVFSVLHVADAVTGLPGGTGDIPEVTP